MSSSSASSSSIDVDEPTHPGPSVLASIAPHSIASQALETYRTRIGAVMNLIEDATSARIPMPTEKEELQRTLDGLVEYLLGAEGTFTASRDLVTAHAHWEEDLQSARASLASERARTGPLVDAILAAIHAGDAEIAAALDQADAFRAAAAAEPYTISQVVAASERFAYTTPSTLSSSPASSLMGLSSSSSTANSAFVESDATSAAVAARLLATANSSKSAPLPPFPGAGEIRASRLFQLQSEAAAIDQPLVRPPVLGQTSFDIGIGGGGGGAQKQAGKNVKMNSYFSDGTLASSFERQYPPPPPLSWLDPELWLANEAREREGGKRGATDSLPSTAASAAASSSSSKSGSGENNAASVDLAMHPASSSNAASSTNSASSSSSSLLHTSNGGIDGRAAENSAANTTMTGATTGKATTANAGAGGLGMLSSLPPRLLQLALAHFPPGWKPGDPLPPKLPNLSQLLKEAAAATAATGGSKMGGGGGGK